MEIEEAIAKGWRFVQPDGKVPMTMEEVEKYFPYGIEIIKN